MLEESKTHTMDFNAAGFSYVDCGVLASEMSIGGAATKTIMAWANCHAFGGSTDGCVFQIGMSEPDELFALRPTGTLDQWRADFWDTWIEFSTPTTSLNTWWHFAVTYDGTDARAYNNGIEVTGGDSPLTITLDTVDDFGLYLGLFDKDDLGFDFFDGDIADVRVYDRELSVAEIQSIYEAKGTDDIVDGLQMRYPMTDGQIGDAMPGLYVDDTEANVGSATSITITVPSHTDGDLLVAAICPGGDASGTPANVTTPSGWTFVVTVDADTALSTTSLWIYTRQASSEPANYNFALVTQTCTIVAQMYCYQNVTTTADDSAVAAGTQTAGPTDPPIAPSLSAGGAGPYLVVRFLAADNGAIGSDPWPIGLNQRNITEDTGVGNGCGLAVGDHIRSAVSTVGTKQFIMGNDEWATATVQFAATCSIKDVSGGVDNHPHDANPSFTVTRVAGELRI